MDKKLYFRPLFLQNGTFVKGFGTRVTPFFVQIGNNQLQQTQESLCNNGS